MPSKPTGAALAFAAAALVFMTLALAACSSSDDNSSATGTPAPASGASPALTAPSATSNCVPGDGPPSQGVGPAGLPGHITYVRLVFGCQPDIAIMDATGSNARLLTDDPALDDESDLSPDGSLVTFFSGRSGSAQIYVMKADGSGVHAITSGSGGDTSPRWSPDGSQIAFSRSGNIVVMKSDGSEQKVVMQAQAATEAEACRAGSFVGSWSPDATSIVYYSAVIRANGDNTFWICSVNVDGSPPKLLVSEPKNKLHAEPYWSPDGKRIVFRDDRDGDCVAGGNCNYDIFTLNLETGEETNVTRHPSLDIEPAWSPDSQWIVFASNREDPNFDLYIIHPDGTGLQRLLADPASKDSYPSWR